MSSLVLFARYNNLATPVWNSALSKICLRHRDLLLNIPPSGPLLLEYLEKTKRLHHGKRTFQEIDENLHKLHENIVSNEELVFAS